MTIKERLGTRRESDRKLKAEVVSLVQYVRQFREEVAQVAADDGEHFRFDNVADQLDAIIRATEHATTSILERVEVIDNTVEELRLCDDAEMRSSLCDKINNDTTATIEACTFQDITGQRVTKIIRSVKFVEDRVGSMIDLWGEEEIDRLATEYATSSQSEGDDALLNGPALDQEASISQDEVDKLFS